MKSRSVCLGVSLVAAVVGAGPAAAADYYAGKSIDLVVGNYPGGGYDIYARTVARSLPRHIPGNPTVVVKNLPGAGGAKAGHTVSNIAPKDGLTIGAVSPGAVVGPRLDDKPETLFDPSKVIYLGTANAGSRICAVFEKSKIKTFDDTMKQKVIFGGVAAGDAIQDFAYMVKRTTKADVEVVSGYKGTLDVTLAMERGEVDGACGWDWSSAKSQKPDWVRDGRLRLLLQIGPKPNAELTQRGVPELWGYIKDDDSRKIAELITLQQTFQRPYFVAPGTPAEYVTILRTAFDATMKDPEFLADAAKMNVDVSPLPGAEVQEQVSKFYAAPKEIVERAKAAIRP
jgi:tripartite-type tricarboxylate transporter receptor subunit TctC